MAGIGIVTNPHSRRNRRYPEQMRRMAYVLGKDDVFDTTKRVDDIRAVARRFRDAEIDILALNGGDGTNHVTLTGFVEVYGDVPLPKVALLRGGTMNTVSNAIGIKGSPNELLVNIVEKYYLGQPFEISQRDLIKVTGAEGSSYGFIFGNGVVANFLRAYYDAGQPSPATAARLLARAAASAAVGGPLIRRLGRSVEATLTADGEPWESGHFTAVVASTINQIGLGFRPFIRCEARPGAFHALAVKGGPMAVVRQMPAMRLGRPLPQSVAPDRVASHLVIEANEPFDYTIDGDLHSASGRLVLETGPRVKIIVK